MSNTLEERSSGHYSGNFDSEQERGQLPARAEYQTRRNERRKYLDLAEQARRGGKSELADRLEQHYHQLIEEEVDLHADRDTRAAWDAVQELSRRESGEAELFWDRKGQLAELTLPRIRKSLLGRDELSSLTLRYSEDGTRTYSASMQGGMYYTEVHHSSDSDWPNIVIAQVHKIGDSDEKGENNSLADR